MGFNTFAILALLIAVAGVRTARDIIRNRRAIFDDNFTDSDRRMVMMTAFYFLVPISVILHECGHAIMVKAFHAEIIDYGFYVFAGFVSYQGYLTSTQQVIIAVAGPFVNVLLAAIALGFMTFKRPPFRAPINELLFQFIVLSIANTLIFYPLLDLGTGLEGDYHQIYFGGVRWLAVVIGIVHAGILLGGFYASRNDRISGYFARLTGLPPGVHRGFMGGYRLANGSAPATQTGALSPSQRLLNAAGQRVASGWDVHVGTGLDRRPSASTLVMQWQREGSERVVFVSVASNGPAEMIGLVDARGNAAKRIELARWPALPSEDQLVLAIRLGMETVDSAASNPDLSLAPA
jgi:hypothetical protein